MQLIIRVAEIKLLRCHTNSCYTYIAPDADEDDAADVAGSRNIRITLIGIVGSTAAVNQRLGKTMAHAYVELKTILHLHEHEQVAQVETSLYQVAQQARLSEESSRSTGAGGTPDKPK